MYNPLLIHQHDQCKAIRGMLNTSETSITSIVVKKIVVNDNGQPNDYIIAFDMV